MQSNSPLRSGETNFFNQWPEIVEEHSTSVEITEADEKYQRMQSVVEKLQKDLENLTELHARLENSLKQSSGKVKKTKKRKARFSQRAETLPALKQNKTLSDKAKASHAEPIKAIWQLISREDRYAPSLLRIVSSLETGDIETALKHFETFPKISSLALQTEVILLKGEILLCEGKMEEAEKCFIQATELVYKFNFKSQIQIDVGVKALSSYMGFIKKNIIEGIRIKEYPDKQLFLNHIICKGYEHLSENLLSHSKAGSSLGLLSLRLDAVELYDLIGAVDLAEKNFKFVLEGVSRLGNESLSPEFHCRFNCMYKKLIEDSDNLTPEQYYGLALKYRSEGNLDGAHNKLAEGIFKLTLESNSLTASRLMLLQGLIFEEKKEYDNAVEAYCGVISYLFQVKFFCEKHSIAHQAIWKGLYWGVQKLESDPTPLKDLDKLIFGYQYFTNGVNIKVWEDEFLVRAHLYAGKLFNLLGRSDEAEEAIEKLTALYDVRTLSDTPQLKLEVDDFLNQGFVFGDVLDSPSETVKKCFSEEENWSTGVPFSPEEEVTSKVPEVANSIFGSPEDYHLFEGLEVPNFVQASFDITDKAPEAANSIFGSPKDNYLFEGLEVPNFVRASFDIADAGCTFQSLGGGEPEAFDSYFN